MSVQVGLLHFNEELVTKAELICMTAPVQDFGPDGESSYVDGRVGMLYRAFHCTAESRSERQPFLSRAGNVIVWCGRLDNREELIADMTDRGEDHSDVALVGAAFDKYGRRCLSRLLGDWALAVWNAGEGELLLARDYVGVQSLFYRLTETRAVWSSHLLALVESEKPLTVREEFIAGYLISKPRSTLTPYSEIQSVEPGSCVRVRGPLAVAERYWRFQPEQSLRYKTDREYEEHYRTVFASSVRSRLRADGPILAELSGGYDSSSIVCMSDHIASVEGYRYVDTFTFVDRGEADEEDSIYSAIIEKGRGRIGHRVEVNGTGDAFRLEDDTLRCVPGFSERVEIKQALPGIIGAGGYRVILSGLAGDEFSGQAVDFRLVLEELLRGLQLIEAGKQLVGWSLDTRIPAIQIIGQTLQMMVGRRNGTRVVDAWVNKDFARRNEDADVKSEARLWWQPNARDVCETAAQYGALLTHKEASREEKRYPFLDRRLLELLCSIPVGQLLRPGERRSLMRRSLRGIVPAEVLSRKTKAGAARTFSLTLEKQWAVLEKTIVKGMLAAQMGIIDHGPFVEALIAMKHGVLPERSVAFIKVLAVEMWLRKVVAQGIARTG